MLFIYIFIYISDCKAQDQLEICLAFYVSQIEKGKTPKLLCLHSHKYLFRYLTLSMQAVQALKHLQKCLLDLSLKQKTGI